MIAILKCILGSVGGCASGGGGIVVVVVIGYLVWWWHSDGAQWFRPI